MLVLRSIYMKPIILMLLLVLSFPLYAALPYKPSATEVTSLPEFCKYKLGYGDKAGDQQWKKVFGKEWVHFHHYCTSLNFLNRANKTFSDKQAKRHYLQNAEGDINYMFGATEKDYFFRPQFYYQLAKIQEKRKDREKAIASYQQAIKLKNDFVSAYMSLSRLYKRMGDIEGAKQILKEGLKHNPESKALKKKLKKLNK